MLKASLVPLLLSLAISSTARAELVDNPTYKSWASFKPGTIVHLQSVTAVPGSKDALGKVTEKLLEVTPEGITLETTTELAAEGQPNKSDTQTNVIKAKMEKGADDPKAPFDNMTGKVIDTKEAKETLEVSGQKIETTVHRQSTLFTAIRAAPADSMAAQLKTVTMATAKWAAPQIPGGIVKSESALLIAGKEAAKMTLTVVDFTPAK